MIEPLIEEFELDHIGMPALEAAAVLADPRLMPALKVLEEEWQGDQDSHTQELQEALERCSNSEVN